jgi:chorismate synthase
MRLILERASARETAARVAVGAVAKSLLLQFDIAIYGQVLSIGRVHAVQMELPRDQLRERLEKSSLLCADPDAESRMRREIDEARGSGNSLGGIFEVVAENVPPGLGSHVHWDRRLDGRLAQAIMSIPAIKGVEIGAGFDSAERRGTEMHDEVLYDANRVSRRSNRAGGIEGGISNGEAIVVRAAMKPIPTTVTPLRTIDLATRRQVPSRYQRSDICAVPAAAVIGEAMVAWILAQAMVEKFGADSLQEMRANYANYLGYLQNRIGGPEVLAE